MRLFVAVELPEEHKRHLDELGQSLKTDSAIVSPAKEHHLTLKFLGDYPDDKVNGLKERLSKISFDSFDGHLDNVGVFPNENNIRVVWVGLKPVEPFAELAKKIDEATPEVKNDHPEYIPHITLVRVKAVKDKTFGEMIKSIKVDPKKFKVDSFKLIKSTLTHSGAVYEVLSTHTAKAL